MSYIKTSLLVLFMLVANNVYAGQAISSLTPIELMSGGYTDQTDQKSYTRIKLSAPHTNPEGCSNNTIIVLDPLDSRYEDRYAMVLMAIGSDMKLSGWTSSCTADGKFTRLTRLSIVK